MMWIDIGVTTLLILRVVLYRPALPPLVDSTIDVFSPEGELNQQESLLVVTEQ